MVMKVSVRLLGSRADEMMISIPSDRGGREGSHDGVVANVSVRVTSNSAKSVSSTSSTHGAGTAPYSSTALLGT